MTTVDEFGYAHHSGRYDRTPKSFATAVLNLTTMSKVKVIGITEVSSHERFMALNTALRKVGWNVIYLPTTNHDTALAYDEHVFNQKRAMNKVASKVPTYSTTGHRRADWMILFVLLEFIESGHTYLFSIGHTPSHVATITHWYDSGRARAHRDGMRHWRRYLRELTLQWKPSGGRVMSMDLNMDVAQFWVRQYLARMFPTMRLVKDRRYVDTHDNRTIDVVLIGRRLNAVRWFKRQYIRVVKVADSDHKSVIVRLRRVR